MNLSYLKRHVPDGVMAQLPEVQNRYNNISDHISYDEAVKTSCKLTNIPSAKSLENMRLLANAIFEPLRCHFGMPIRINSFYRCYEVNTSIGGSTASQHMCGALSGWKEAAIDITSMTRAPTNATLFKWLRENVEFDQLIWEFGSDIGPDWIHVSYRHNANRKQIMKSTRISGKTVYRIQGAFA